MFFERRCPVCGASSRLLCRPCASRLRPGPSIQVEGLATTTALLTYDDVSSELVVAGKNGGRRDLLEWSAHHLAAAVADGPVPVDSIQVVTWVPAHPTQRRARGYDQGEIIARTVARRLGIRCRPLLRRTGGGRQKGLARADRLDGPAVRHRRQVSGHVLLVDDVATTGASLQRSASALMIAGADRVDGAVVAAVEAGRRPDVRADGGRP